METTTKLTRILAGATAALRKTRATLGVLLTCDHCAACEYCNGHKILRLEIAEIDAALALKDVQQ